MNKIGFLIISIFILSVSISKAQNYKTAVGVRGGFPTGLNAKYFFTKKDAVEAIVSAYRGGFEITALYEKQSNAFDIPYLEWYYGGGFHAGFFNADIARPGYYFEGRGRGFTIGLDGVIGLEYVFTNIPWVLGIDLKPTYDFTPNPGIWFGGGISFRFYF
ncbi:hypothetical protein QYS48_24640 [Marivirga arenosa]|uniref:Uncharacterized protein n=1 Tax=Marivirga arenosa TaxID=3059076 RepID=A0AA49GFP3_9BACT|nr:hypothetical protein [Marivirga sp. ABR2-2]WKK85150.1 hypothetical protein QYS48_24640 [Marivirga sp. ABR2-2]